jgi:hypothetical protein
MTARTTPEERDEIRIAAEFDASRVGAPGSAVRLRAEATLRLLQERRDLLAERDALEAERDAERARAEKAEADAIETIEQFNALMDQRDADAKALALSLRAEVARLRDVFDAAQKFAMAVDACDAEAELSERTGQAWSSAPMVRQIGALRRLRVALAKGGA